jgi:LacI family transcriptional regulator
MNIREVAERAGVSCSTVSLVLNGRAGVAEETRRAVQRVLKEVGYRRRQPGRRRKRAGEPPARNRTNRIAFVVIGTSPAVLKTPVYADVLRGAEAAVSEAGKMFVLRHIVGSGPGAGPMPQRVDGAILFGRVSPRTLPGDIRDIPAVQAMGWQVDQAADWDHVTYDDKLAGHLAAEYLIRRGHGVCAYIGPSGGNHTRLGGRAGAFCHAVRGAGARVHVVREADLFQVTQGAQTVDRVKLSRIADRLLGCRPVPAAAFVWADQITSALYPVLAERGLRPGIDLEIVSCNRELPYLESLSPRPATVDIHAEKVGRSAVARLFERIETPEAPREIIRIAPALLPGESCWGSAEPLTEGKGGRQP